jgi:hypothetical protein
VQKTPVHPFSFSSSQLDEAFQRARAELRAREAGAHGDDAGDDDDSDDPGDEPARTTEDGVTEPLGERLLMGHELLLAVREPIEWLLALARRLADGDPDDAAAIDRLTAAFHNRLGRGSHGVTVADALTAFGILISALDPTVVLTAASKTIADGVVTLLACESAALAGQLARMADAMPAALRGICTPRARKQQATRAGRTL